MKSRFFLQLLYNGKHTAGRVSVSNPENGETILHMNIICKGEYTMDNEKKMDEMLNKKVWAVIGATPNTEKTANRIFHTLRNHGYETYAVNPNYKEMEDGTRCYACLEDLPQKPDCVDFVIPPSVTLKSLEEMDPKEYPHIWLQPGTYDEEIVKFAEEKGFKVVHEGACAMAAVRLR